MEFSQAIQRCKRGDPAAQKHLFNLYAEPMFLLCRRYVGNREDAEERMLNGFLRFFRTIARFRDEGQGTAAPWLRRIMINECLMFLRSSRQLSIVPADGGQELPIDEDILSSMQAGELYALILDLPPGYRTVFNLYVLDGLSHPEIACALGISEGTSRSQLRKARSWLQRMVLRNETVRRTPQIPPR